jgi:uncharacterized membrane protein
MFDSAQNTKENGIAQSNKLFRLLLVGFVLIITGVIVLAVSAVYAGGSGSFGGVIFIGPIPIVFGAGPDAGWLMLISVIIVVVTLGLFVIYRRSGKIRF